jgi:hypothetical protein
VLGKINASLIPLLFKPFVKFDIAYSRPPLGDICVLSPSIGTSGVTQVRVDVVLCSILPFDSPWCAIVLKDCTIL